jgi:uncharacterized membrane protein
MVIPIMTFFANLTILLDIPILREIVVFIFLSFIPGFALLRLFKLKETSFLDNILFSVGLSIVLVMFVGLLVNELYLFLGLLQPLETFPLTLAISGLSLTFFLIGYRRDLIETVKLNINFENKTNLFPLFIILFLLPVISGLGVLYFNVSVILLSYAIIVALCLMSVVSRRLVPEKMFPFLIFSISIALVCQVPLTSKYIVGWDANLEYYVFRLTQLNGHWGLLNTNVYSLGVSMYDSMLSITLLPSVYSVLMRVQGEIVFKMLFPFLLSLIPLTLYRICEKQFGKMVGLLSILFFVFTYTAFYGPEILSLNRQIVSEFFLLLSIFLLINKTIPMKIRRLFLIIFGATIVVSHYSIAYIYLIIVTLIFIISRLKPKLDSPTNTLTISLIWGITFFWYSIGSSPTLTLFTNTIKAAFDGLFGNLVFTAGTTSTAIFAAPKIFTVASWINLLLSGLANLCLIVGVLVIILRPKSIGISAQFKAILIAAAIILVVSFIAPSISAVLNFTRFYGITLLFLSPCFVLGGQALLVTIGKVWTKIKRPLKHQISSKNRNIDRVFLLIAVILGGYFLSQVGFVNNVTNSPIHSYTIDFNRLKMSNESQVKIGLYNAYFPEQDVFSAFWLLNHKADTAEVFGGYDSVTHVLVSYGLINPNLLAQMTNTTILPQGSFIYLGSSSVVDGILTTATSSFNTSEISTILDQNNLIYSNSYSEIWYVVPPSD